MLMIFYHTTYTFDEVGNVGIFILLNFENKLEIVVSHIAFNSKHHDKSIFALKMIQLVLSINKIRSCTIMPILPSSKTWEVTHCICLHSLVQCKEIS